MSENIFTIDSQASLNALIHRSQDSCVGDCEWCKEFHKARKFAHALAIEKGIVMSFTANNPTVEIDGHWQGWCEECSDGVNDTFFETAWWVRHHAIRRHGM